MSSIDRLNVGVDRQLQRSALAAAVPAVDLLDLTADAVDDEHLFAVGAHEQLVVGLLDPGLSDQRARLDTRIFGARQLRFVDLADVAEEMRRKVTGRILPRRHLLIHDAGQLPFPARGPR